MTLKGVGSRLKGKTKSFAWSLEPRASSQLERKLKRHIRNIPDFPKPGILFRDITPLLRRAGAFQSAIRAFVARYRRQHIDAIVAIESRGFIFGAALAHALKVGFVPVRKPGKLPHAKERIEYALEYGTDALEIHLDGITRGERVLVVDDLLATGGTARAVVDLINRLGGQVVEAAFLVELTALNGRSRLAPHAAFSLIRY